MFGKLSPGNKKGAYVSIFYINARTHLQLYKPCQSHKTLEHI